MKNKNYVDLKIKKLNKEKKDIQIQKKQLFEDVNKFSKENLKRFKKIYKATHEKQIKKLVDFLDKEHEGTDFRFHVPGSGGYRVWIQHENIMIDIVRLRISLDDIEVETLDREGTSLMDVGTLKRFKLKDKDKAFKYYIDKIIDASKTIENLI